MNRAVHIAWIVMFIHGSVPALTIKVPGDFPGIQLALESIADGDTILVTPGVYSEALVAPALQFVLKCDLEADTSDGQRPIVDPSRIPGSDTLACLTLPELSRVVIEDFAFRNGSEMYPRGGIYVGGIQSRANSVTMRRCEFDSTYGALSQQCCPPQVGIVDTAIDCAFRNVQVRALNVLDYPMYARNCTFETTNCLQHALGGDGSRFINCHFGSGASLSCLVLNGDSTEAANCIFGPIVASTQRLLATVQGLGNARVHDNTFIGNTTTESAVFARASAPRGFTIEHNEFSNQHSGLSAVLVNHGNPFGDHRGGTILNNRFVDCFSDSDTAHAVYANADVAILDNRFEEFAVDESGIPAIAIVGGGRSSITENYFVNTGYALKNYPDSMLSAVGNFWGSSTGPYHAELNPDGLGDTITGNVGFEPWLTDTTDAANDRGGASPSEFRLTIFPNPFNSTARISFAAPAGEYRLDLFNALGQHVQEIWQGDVSGTELLHFDASNFSTGIYFLRAWEIKVNTTAALEKIVLLK